VLKAEILLSFVHARFRSYKLISASPEIMLHRPGDYRLPGSTGLAEVIIWRTFID